MARKYFLELGGALALYAVVLVVSLMLIRQLDLAQPVEIIVALLPMIPAIGVAWAVVRHFRRLDEYQRKIQLDAFAIAFAGTALITFSYGFLEIVGFPPLSMFYVGPLMSLLWGLSVAVGSARGQ